MDQKDILVVRTIFATLDPDSTERKEVGLRPAASLIGLGVHFYHTNNFQLVTISNFTNRVLDLSSQNNIAFLCLPPNSTNLT